MLPVFGLHLIFAAALVWVLRGSLPAAGAACLAFGNPLTHAVLLPAEYALGRCLLPPSAEFLPSHGPGWLLALLPVAEETATGGLLLAAAAGLSVWWLAQRALQAAKPQ